MTLHLLKPGVSVDEDVLRFVLDLERRGVQGAVTADGHLQVGPQALITPADYRAIHESRHEIARILRHVLPPPEVAP